MGLSSIAGSIIQNQVMFQKIVRTVLFLSLEPNDVMKSAIYLLKLDMPTGIVRLPVMIVIIFKWSMVSHQMS